METRWKEPSTRSYSALIKRSLIILFVCLNFDFGEWEVLAVGRLADVERKSYTRCHIRGSEKQTLSWETFVSLSPAG